MSSTNPLRLNLDGRTADIQVVQNYLTHGGRIQTPIEGDNQMSWASTPKLNGIHLFNYLTKNKFNVELIDSYYNAIDHFKQLLDRNPRVVIISTTFIPGKQNLVKLAAHFLQLFYGGRVCKPTRLQTNRMNVSPADHATDVIREFLQSQRPQHHVRMTLCQWYYRRRVQEIRRCQEILVQYVTL